MKRRITILFLFTCFNAIGQTFFIGHNETVSDSINRAWNHYEIIDSLVFPNRKDFIIITNIRPMNFISEAEKKYLRYSKRKPDKQDFFTEFYPDSSYQNYLAAFKKELEEYRKDALKEYKYNNSLEKLLFIQNSSSDTIKIPIQDGSLIGLLEARGKTKSWKSIQYWWYSWCGNSYSWIDLLPNQSLKIGVNNNIGSIKTMLRFKLHGNDTIYLSQEFEGKINQSQFELTKEVKQLMRKHYHGVSFLDSVSYGLCEEDLGVELEIIEE